MPAPQDVHLSPVHSRTKTKPDLFHWGFRQLNYGTCIQWKDFAAIKNDVVELHLLTLKDDHN